MNVPLQATPMFTKSFSKTSLFLSFEKNPSLSNSDIRNWGVDSIDEETRREIFVSGWGSTTEEELAEALGEPLRYGVLDGDIIGDLFDRQELPNSSTIEFPLDLLDRDLISGETFTSYTTKQDDKGSFGVAIMDDRTFLKGDF